MLRVPLQASWILAGILATAHCAAVAVLVVTGLPAWLQVTAILALAVSLVFSVGNSALQRLPQSVAAIKITATDLLSVQSRRGEWLACEVLGSTFVASMLTVLNLQETKTNAVRHVVILPDSMDGDDFRRLRVWLRWKHGTQRGAQ